MRRNFPRVCSGPLLLLGASLFCASGLIAQTGAWFIDTVAGTDRPVNDGPRATQALLDLPGSVVVDSNGNVIFADTGNHRVRQISPNGSITTIFGTGVPGYSGDGGPAAAAQIVSPQGLALDGKGNLYVTDYSAHVIRKIDSTGMVTTIAGTGVAGSSGSGGKATAARLNGPYALAFDLVGNLYVAEDLNNAVRRITPDGNIVTFASGINNPEGLAVDSANFVYISAWGDQRVVKVSPSGSMTVVAGSGNYGFAGDNASATAASLAGPQGLAIDSSGVLWICDSGNNRIRKVTTAGTIQTAIGSGYSGLTNFTVDPTSGAVYLPNGVFVDAKGTVYWSEAGNNRIRSYSASNKQLLDLAGSVSPLKATGGPTSLLLYNPFSAATDAAGNIYIADTTNHVIRKITPAGVSSIVAGTGAPALDGEVGQATALSLASPQGVSVDAQGNLYIADTGNGRVRKVDTTGRMTTLMGAGQGLPFPGTFDANDFLFAPTAVVPDGNGGFVVVDEIFGIVATVNAVGTVDLIRTASVNFLTLPIGIAVSGRNIFIADTFANRVLLFDGTNISVAAGNGIPGYGGDGKAAIYANLLLPTGVAVDSKGNLYIADTGNNVIRMVDTTGKISTIAGTGQAGFSGDKGPAASAQFANPTSVSVDASGNLLVTDRLNQRIRQLKFLQVAPDLTLTTDAVTKSANHGATVTVNLTLASVGGFAGTATLSSTGPAGVTVQFAPASPITVAAGQSVSVVATAQIPASLTPGSYTLGINVVSGSVQHSVSVALTVTNLPQFPSAGVVSAASGSGNGVSPGEIVAVYGQDLGPASLALGTFDANNILSNTVGGTQVLFDGKPAPLIYSVAGQLSAIVPYAVAGKTSTQVQVLYNGKSSPMITVPVVDAAPGIFNVPGGSQAAALNADLSVNNTANPAAKGSVIVLFATGEGQTSPAGVDGKIATDTFPKPVLPVTVTIGGAPAQVLYYGAAPFEVAGVLQINAMIPATVASGPAPVVVQVGTRTSAMSTIAVQ